MLQLTYSCSMKVMKIYPTLSFGYLSVKYEMQMRMQILLRLFAVEVLTIYNVLCVLYWHLGRFQLELVLYLCRLKVILTPLSL